MADDRDDRNEPSSGQQQQQVATAAATPLEHAFNKKTRKKRRMSASEYQKYIVMEQGTMEIDLQGNPHLAEEEKDDMMLTTTPLPSWLLISETVSSCSSSKSVSPQQQQQENDDIGDAYVSMNARKGQQEEEYMHESTRWQRWKAEFCDVFHELVHYGKNKSWKKKILTVFVCVSSLLVFADLIFFGNIVVWLQSFIMWMGNNIAAGIFAFIGLFVITTLVFVPPTILTFGAGYICSQVCGLIPGIITATLACFIGSVLGAVIAFFRARYMMRDLVQLFAKRYSIIRATDKALKRHGFRVMLLLRLCPLIPFHALNYIGGITSVKWEAFTASMIGMLPIQILTVTIGATTESLINDTKSDDEQLGYIVLVCSGLAFMIIAFVIIFLKARHELKMELESATLLESTASTLGTPTKRVPDDEEENLTHLGIEHGIEVDEAWYWLWV